MRELTLDQLLALGRRDQKFSLAGTERGRVAEAARRVQRLAAEGQRAYGIHTHYGHNLKDEVAAEDFPRHQQELLDYLHVGVGPSLSVETVRRALRLQCLKVAEGRSGVSPELLDAVLTLADGPCDHPVPSLGSLGASGDLIPMAHAIAPAVRRSGIRGPRDVVGMVNTNAMMASLAAENYAGVRDFLSQAHEITALVSLALDSNPEHFDPALFGESNRLQEEQVRSARRIREARERLTSELSVDAPDAPYSPGEEPADVAAPLQERYSVRVAPQVLGNAGDLLSFAEKKILMEALAVADNPVLSEKSFSAQPDSDGGGPDPGAREGVFLHGGLFYAASLATAADSLGDILQSVATMLDRQVLLLMDRHWSHGLPDNLSLGGGDHLKGIHQLLSALVQKLKGLSTRSHELGFSAEQNNQDVLPAAMTVQLQLRESLVLARQVLRAARFSAERGAHLRLGIEVPEELRLSAWEQFSV